MINRLPILTVLLMVTLAGCSTFRFPGVHRIAIQQGNVITQQMVDKLKPGMTKSQVRFVLGNPVIDDSLSYDRWDYVYSIAISGNEPIIRQLHLHFIENRLSYMNGDFKPTDPDERQAGAENSGDMPPAASTGPATASASEG